MGKWTFRDSIIWMQACDRLLNYVCWKNDFSIGQLWQYGNINLYLMVYTIKLELGGQQQANLNRNCGPITHFVRDVWEMVVAGGGRSSLTSIPLSIYKILDQLFHVQSNFQKTKKHKMHMRWIVKKLKTVRTKYFTALISGDPSFGVVLWDIKGMEGPCGPTGWKVLVATYDLNAIGRIKRESKNKNYK